MTRRIPKPGATGLPLWQPLALCVPAVLGGIAWLVLNKFADWLEAADDALWDFGDE